MLPDGFEETQMQELTSTRLQHLDKGINAALLDEIKYKGVVEQAESADEPGWAVRAAIEDWWPQGRLSIGWPL